MLGFENIVFDRRGQVYPKPNRQDVQSPGQGDYRQVMSEVVAVAQALTAAKVGPSMADGDSLSQPQRRMACFE